jgi:HD domain
MVRALDVSLSPCSLGRMPWGQLRPDELGFGAAWETAGELLAGSLPRRWAHSQGVCHRAFQVGPQVVTGDEALLAQAAILHDVGYSPEIAHTGFHALDGAVFLRSVGIDDRVVALVAHHSCASVEADERGLAEELSRFPDGPPGLTDALIYCDMTVSPDGMPVSVEGRMSEILDRYGVDSLVGRFIQRAAPELRAATGRVQGQLLAHSAEHLGLSQLNWTRCGVQKM